MMTMNDMPKMDKEYTFTIPMTMENVEKLFENGIIENAKSNRIFTAKQVKTSRKEVFISLIRKAQMALEAEKHHDEIEEFLGFLKENLSTDADCPPSLEAETHIETEISLSVYLTKDSKTNKVEIHDGNHRISDYYPGILDGSIALCQKDKFKSPVLQEYLNGLFTKREVSSTSKKKMDITFFDLPKEIQDTIKNMQIRVSLTYSENEAHRRYILEEKNAGAKMTTAHYDRNRYYGYSLWDTTNDLAKNLTVAQDTQHATFSYCGFKAKKEDVDRLRMFFGTSEDACKLFLYRNLAYAYLDDGKSDIWAKCSSSQELTDKLMAATKDMSVAAIKKLYRKMLDDVKFLLDNVYTDDVPLDMGRVFTAKTAMLGYLNSVETKDDVIQPMKDVLRVISNGVNTNAERSYNITKGDVNNTYYQLNRVIRAVTAFEVARQMKEVA